MLRLCPDLTKKVNSLVPSEFIAVHWQIISILFYFGVLLMGLRLVVQFISLYLMHRKSKPAKIDNYPVRILNEAVSPFSFWQTVYINPKLHEERELRTILAHEQIHVKEWHSLDILLAELSVVFYWFNPGVWLMKKAVKENLEFITDQRILNKGIDRKTYQYSLLDVGNLTPAAAIVNNFNLSDLKKRIKMMNVKRSSRLTLSRYLLVTPVLLVTTLAFTVSKKDIKKHFAPIHQVLVDHKLILEHEPILPAKTNRKIKKDKVKSLANINTDTISPIRRFINTILITTDSTKSNAEITNQLIKLAAKNISARDTSVRLVHFIHNVRQSDEQTAPSDLKDITLVKRVRGFETPPTVIVTGYRTKPKTALTGEPKNQLIFRSNSSVADTATLHNATFYIDGKKVTAEDLRILDAKRIQSIDVIKGKDLEPIIVVGQKRN